MSPIAIIIITLFCIALATAVIYQYVTFRSRNNPFTKGLDYHYIPAKLGTLEQHLFTLINTYRKDCNVDKVLKADSYATELSKLRCLEMISQNEFFKKFTLIEILNFLC